MTISTIVFIISFCGIFLLIASKVFQIKVGQINILQKITSFGDVKIHGTWAIVLGKYMLYKKITRLFIFDFLPSYVYEQLVRAKDYVSKKYYQFGTGFQGRRVLRNTGSVSFFLERLAEEKPENR